MKRRGFEADQRELDELQEVEDDVFVCSLHVQQIHQVFVDARFLPVKQVVHVEVRVKVIGLKEPQKAALVAPAPQTRAARAQHSDQTRRRPQGRRRRRGRRTPAIVFRNRGGFERSLLCSALGALRCEICPCPCLLFESSSLSETQLRWVPRGRSPRQEARVACLVGDRFPTRLDSRAREKTKDVKVAAKKQTTSGNPPTEKALGLSPETQTELSVLPSFGSARASTLWRRVRQREKSR